MKSEYEKYYDEKRLGKLLFRKLFNLNRTGRSKLNPNGNESFNKKIDHWLNVDLLFDKNTNLIK